MPHASKPSSLTTTLKRLSIFLKQKVAEIPELHAVSEFIHFACTSEDINNLSHALMLKTARDEVILPYWRQLIDGIKDLALPVPRYPAAVSYPRSASHAVNHR